jgi:uncharacterized protein (UPF0303 family)
MNYTIESLDQEQQELLLDRFDYDFVWHLGASMHERAVAVSAPIAITIAHGPDLVFSTLMPGATPDNSDWAARKRAVAQRFHRSSLAMRLEAEKNGIDFNHRYRLSESDFAACGGGVPLILRSGTLIGTAGVSGLPDIDDHRLIVDTLRQLLAKGRPVPRE